MENDKRTAKWLNQIGVVLIFVAILVLLWFLLNGSTTIENKPEESKTIETLVCESDEVSYPIFDFDHSISKSLKINVIFEDDSVESIALFYGLDYSDEETMKKSESHNHAAMNMSFYDAGMKTDDLNAKYSFVDKRFQMSIYTKKSEITQKSMKYFMLNDLYDINELNKEKTARIYNDKGLDCVVINNKEVNGN